MEYTKDDCIRETKDHIDKVNKNLSNVIEELKFRGRVHDLTKLQEPELSVFVEYTPKLKNSTYGSDKYKSFLKGMQVALNHHYENNSHHPEHYDNGVNGMSLLDVVEMLCDWKAATERHNDGDIRKSLALNKERFNISDQLYEIMLNTINELGW